MANWPDGGSRAAAAPPPGVVPDRCPLRRALPPCRSGIPRKSCNRCRWAPIWGWGAATPRPSRPCSREKASWTSAAGPASIVSWRPGRWEISGRVIGVDMTAEMVAKARENAREAGYVNVEFRLGEIEHLPVADASVDVIISNCVINLSPDKGQVFREAFRVLRPGGRLAISDVVATASMPEEMRNELALYAGCLAGAATIDHLEAMLREAGFQRDPHSDSKRRAAGSSGPGLRERDGRLRRLGQH